MRSAINTFDYSYQWAALALAIVSEKYLSVEQALHIIDNQKMQYRYSTEDSKDMVALKKVGLSVDEIADIYGVHKMAVYQRIKRYEQQKRGGKGVG